MNGLPTLVAERDVPETGSLAPRWALNLEVDAEGRVLWARTVLAPRKLTAL